MVDFATCELAYDILRKRRASCTAGVDPPLSQSCEGWMTNCLSNFRTECCWRSGKAASVSEPSEAFPQRLFAQQQQRALSSGSWVLIRNFSGVCVRGGGRYRQEASLSRLLQDHTVTDSRETLWPWLCVRACVWPFITGLTLMRKRVGPVKTLVFFAVSSCAVWNLPDKNKANHAQF